MLDGSSGAFKTLPLSFLKSVSWQQHQRESLPSQPWAHSPIARWQLWFGLHYKNSCKIEQDLTLRLRGFKKAPTGLQGITYLSRPHLSEAGGPRKRKNDDFSVILKWSLPRLGCQIWHNVTFSGKSPEDFANRPLQVTWPKVLFSFTWSSNFGCFYRYFQGVVWSL